VHNLENINVLVCHCLEPTISRSGGNFGITGADLIFCAIAADVLSRAASAATVLTTGRLRAVIVVAAFLHGLRIIAVLHKTKVDRVGFVCPAQENKKFTRHRSIQGPNSKRIDLRFLMRKNAEIREKSQ
jgi:hypothetical protein